MPFSTIKEIKILYHEDEVNDLLDDWWILLKICDSENGPVFVMGRDFYESFRDCVSDFDDDEGTDEL